MEEESRKVEEEYFKSIFSFVEENDCFGVVKRETKNQIEANRIFQRGVRNLIQWRFPIRSLEDLYSASVADPSIPLYEQTFQFVRNNLHYWEMRRRSGIFPIEGIYRSIV